jgi:hypothetical protein
MGPARFWDDPDADLQRTVDLPLPPAVRRRFEPTPREFAILREVIDAIRLVGALLVVGGLFAVFGMRASLGARVRPAAMVTGLVTLPGALYVVASLGQTARRYWAWVMSLVVTVLLMATLLGVGVYFVAFAPGAGAPTLVVPVALYFSMPGLILLYMLRALPVVRDAELLSGNGFLVLPANKKAAAESPPPPLAVQIKPEDSSATSPSPAPPAPWPPTPPPRS